MFGWFKSDPIKKLRKQISSKEEQAMQLQRNGKLREFAELTKLVLAEIDFDSALGHFADDLVSRTSLPRSPVAATTPIIAPIGVHIRRGDRIKRGAKHAPGVRHDHTDVTEAAAVYKLALQSLHFLREQQQQEEGEEQHERGRHGDLSVFVVSDDARRKRTFEDAVRAMGLPVVSIDGGGNVNSSSVVVGGGGSGDRNSSGSDGSHLPPPALSDFFGLTLCSEVWMVSAFSSFAVMAAAVADVPLRSLYSPSSTSLARYGVDATPFPNATWPWE